MLTAVNGRPRPHGRRGPRARSARRLLGALALALWAFEPTAAGQSFEGQGRVMAVDEGRNTVTIQHSTIPGLLPATRSEFPVRTAGVLQGVHLGDRVRFTLDAADDTHGLLTVLSVAPESTGGAGWLDRVMQSAAVALGLLTLAAAAAVGVVLWRNLQILHRRVVALDHEVGTLRGLITDTQDGVRQIAKALDDAATALRLGYIQELGRRIGPAAPLAAIESANALAPGESAGAVVVIERGRGALYRAVEGGAAGPGLAVIWDRRRSERRRSARRPIGHERRRTERRGSPPATWRQLGFQVVPGDAADATRAARLLRPGSADH
jgi:Cu/Ag efflux protein CusF